MLNSGNNTEKGCIGTSIFIFINLDICEVFPHPPSHLQVSIKVSHIKSETKWDQGEWVLANITPNAHKHIAPICLILWESFHLDSVPTPLPSQYHSRNNLRKI